MAGVVLETLSNKKLLILGLILILLQIVFFLIGGLIAPSPSNVQQILATKCIDRQKNKNQWMVPRVPVYNESHNIMTMKPGCNKIGDWKEAEANNVTADEVVFAFQLPLPKDGMELEMSRWFQNMISVLMVDAEDFDHDGPTYVPGALMKMDARLGYRNMHETSWNEIVRSNETRKFECEKVEKGSSPYMMNCELLQFFELGSCHYDQYLVNIRLPTMDNENLGQIQDLTLVIIHPNGGFTKVWLSMKTVMFPVLLMVVAFFWNRITMLKRPPMLLEKSLFGLGCTLSFLNFPVEWLTLWFNMPFMLLLMDVRQGIFYAMLLSFWLLFAGEHLMDSIVRNSVTMYWKHLGAVLFGCICLFTFEICERGVQLSNPFYSIWITDIGSKLALGFIILAGIAACVYFFFLCYMVYCVFRNISAKKTAFPHLSSVKKKFYTGLIFRFKFLMIVTLVCAACTVAFFIMSQVKDGEAQWGDDIHLEYASAFFTGVYGMWNLYVICLLILYAPSHKLITTADSLDDSIDEEIEFSTIPSEVSALSGYLKKDATD